MFGHEAGCGGTITITVTPVNDPPVAGDQTLVTDEDTPLPIALAGTDADGDTLSFTWTQPGHGLYDGTAYTPTPGYNGPARLPTRQTTATAAPTPPR